MDGMRKHIQQEARRAEFLRKVRWTESAVDKARHGDISDFDLIESWANHYGEKNLFSRFGVTPDEFAMWCEQFRVQEGDDTA